MKTAVNSRSIAAGVLLALALIAAYVPSLGGDFLWDDDLHITANPVVVGPLGLKEIWTTSRANYFPLVLTNFWAQHAVWGVQPLGYRLVTLAFHIGAALLLWRVLSQLGVPAAWLGAALWALHPVQVESVAWICELKNTQSALFFLAAIWFWTRWVGGGAAPRADREGLGEASLPDSAVSRYWATLLCALLAILSKPSTVMLPIVLGLVTWWLRRRFTARDLLGLVPFLVLSAIAAGWTIWEQKFHSGASGAEWAQTWPERLVLAGRVVWFYLGKLVWPEALAFIYPRWTLNAAQPLAYLPLLGVMAALAALAWRRGRARAGFFAAAYFVALLFPVLGFFDVYFFRYSFVGDHFQYLASIGPLAALAAGIAVVARRALPALGAGVALALGVLTGLQSADYRSSETLWSGTLARNPGSAMAWAQLGAVHARAARHNDAVAAFQRALRLNPEHPEALNHLGCEQLRAGRVNDAIATLQRAVAARPNFAEAQCNLGIAWLQSDRADQALVQFEAARRARPDAPQPQHGVAQALLALGRTAEALPEFEEAIRREPRRAQIYDDFGLALAAAGRNDEAVAAHRRALELQPALASAHNHLGVLLAQSGRVPDALAHFDSAVRSDPGYVAAHVNRGGALAALHRFTEAREAFAQAVRLAPDSPRAHGYLAQVLQALGREAEARDHFVRAAELERAAGPSR